MTTNSDQIKTHITVRGVQTVTNIFSHANSHKGAECHPVIYCPKHLALVVSISPFEWGRIVGLQEARHIDGLLHMLDTVYWWCVAASSTDLWNIYIPIDQVLEGHLVQMHVKIDPLCEQRWPSEQHPGKKSGHMLHLLYYQGPLGTICLQQDKDNVCLWPGYHFHHDTAKLGYSGVIKDLTGE